MISIVVSVVLVREASTALTTTPATNPANITTMTVTTISSTKLNARRTFEGDKRDATAVCMMHLNR